MVAVVSDWPGCLQDKGAHVLYVYVVRATFPPRHLQHATATKRLLRKLEFILSNTKNFTVKDELLLQTRLLPRRLRCSSTL